MGWLRRGKGLTRRALRPSLVGLRRSEIRRHTPLHAKPKASVSVPVDVRQVVAGRSGGLCEIASEGCWRRASAMHHRQARKSGGRCGEALSESDRASNLIHICKPCHEWTHLHPWLAGFYGWIVPAGGDPARRPVVLLRHNADEQGYLDDEGGWHSLTDAGT